MNQVRGIKLKVFRMDLKFELEIYECLLQEFAREAIHLKDAKQLTSGRRDYVRWDFDAAIKAPPPTQPKPLSHGEKAMIGRDTIMSTIEARLSSKQRSQSLA
jgi:hypothetical protein